MLTHIITPAYHKTCPHHRNISYYTLAHHNTLDTTQMTSLVVHVDITDSTDGTTLLTSWTYEDDSTHRL